MVRRAVMGLGAVLVVSGVAGAQDVREAGVGFAAWRVPLEERDEGVLGGWSAESGAEGEFAEGAGLEGLLGSKPPPVARETLEGPAETLQRYDGLPGGIVLGLEARVGGELVGAGGARIGGSIVEGLELRLADGRVLRAPRIAPDRLAACLAFTAGRDDAVVDLQRYGTYRPRVAAAFAGGALERELVELDLVPHKKLRETSVWKSVIVDREVRVSVRDGELALDADLEVRFYIEGRGWARRVRSVAVAGSSWIGPRLEDDLGDELAPLAELASWLGFLRWAERVDPEGIARLRSEGAVAQLSCGDEGH